MIKGEIITVKEALERLGLDIGDDRYWGCLVEWTGYPKPFACGHTAIYGFGPLDNPKDNGRNGKGRRYQENVRVNQYLCGGAVLYSWPRVDYNQSFLLNSDVVVCIDTIPDSHDTCLRIGITA